MLNNHVDDCHFLMPFEGELIAINQFSRWSKFVSKYMRVQFHSLSLNMIFLLTFSGFYLLMKINTLKIFSIEPCVVLEMAILIVFITQIKDGKKPKLIMREAKKLKISCCLFMLHFFFFFSLFTSSPFILLQHGIL